MKSANQDGHYDLIAACVPRVQWRGCELVLMDNRTETAAYGTEYETMREYDLAGKRDQLCTMIPRVSNATGAASVY